MVLLGSNSANRHSVWKICLLLLLASALNYMDRQTLSNAATRITQEFKLSNQQYGALEQGFGWSFAAGSLFFGLLADKFSLRWVYLSVVVLWSGVGFVTGFVDSYEQLFLCRCLLGFFEAGHWPCGVKATRLLLDDRHRAMGNSVLQSGTSIGAIITPLLMLWLMSSAVGSWRFVFQAIGALGLLWMMLWLGMTRDKDFEEPCATEGRGEAKRPLNWITLLLTRKMFLVLLVISLINTTWQLIRAWLPKFLQEGRGFSEPEALLFNSFWYATTEVGCLGSGGLALWLANRSMSPGNARIVTFLACSLMCATTLAIPWLQHGPVLLGVLLVAGAGALGLFPIYHSLSQEISGRHQGKVTGIASVVGWLVSSPAQRSYGEWIDRTKSFDGGLAMAGCLPLLASLLLVLFWPRTPIHRPSLH